MIRSSSSRTARLPLLIAAITSLGIPALSVSPARAGLMSSRPPDGFEETFGLGPDQKAKDYAVQEIATSSPANVLWPGESPSFTLQFTNKAAAPLQAKGKVDVIQYRTESTTDVFQQKVSKVADLGSVPIEVDVPAGGYQNITIKPSIPEKFGGYALVTDLGDHGRALTIGCVRVPESDPGKYQFPTYALDAQDRGPEEMAMFSRLGIKGMRMEWGYVPTTSKDFYQKLDQLAEWMAFFRKNNVTVMLTMAAGGPQPLGRPRPFLDDQNRMLSTKSDMAWLPENDDDFQKYCKIIAGTFGWPRGPVNAMELWNEPWEGISISGWGADMLRYRDIYTHMAQGIEEARQEDGVKVLIGGTCSSMNTDDKLFCDGTDTFLKWLDFTSIHYQPMDAMPALIPEWVNRKSAYGPVQAWDTESWVANSEDRVAAVLASMRAQGLSRTAGVFHDSVRDIQRVRARYAGGVYDLTMVQTWTPGAAIAATQQFIGQRTFKQLLFQNGLPWVFEFNGTKTPDDGSMVIVGDLSGVYERDLMLFHTVRGLKGQDRVAELKKQLDALPSTAPAKDRTALQAAYKAAQVLQGGSLTIPDGGGMFILCDFFGNPVPAVNGKIVVPLNGLGYFLRTDGSPGSFVKLEDAVKTSRIDGFEPVEIVAHDMLTTIDTQPTLRLTLTNILNRPITGKLSVKLGDLTLDKPDQTVDLQGNETKDFPVVVTAGKASPDNTYLLTERFDAGADGAFTHTEDMHVNVISHKTIKVDGDLTDWQGVLPQPVRSLDTAGPNLTERAWLPFMKYDSSIVQGLATGYTAYDDNNFYFAAKIADSTPSDGGVRFATRDDDQYFYPEKVTAVDVDPKTKVETTSELTWPDGLRCYSYRKRPAIPSGDHTDNVQLGFGVIPLGQNDCLPNPPGTMPKFMSYKSTDYEYALNQVAAQYGGGTEVWRLSAPGVPRKHYFPRQPKAPIDGGPVQGAALSIRWDGNTRIVECSIPWTEMPEVKKHLDAGQTIRFTFRVNDNAPGAQGYELAGGRSVSKIDNYALHDFWATHWANEVEFAFGK